jgi:hypothetical protein
MSRVQRREANYADVWANHDVKQKGGFAMLPVAITNMIDSQ